MKRLLILLVIAAAGTVAACAPSENATGAPDDSAMPTLAPSTDPLTESPAMSAEPTTAPS